MRLIDADKLIEEIEETKKLLEKGCGQDAKLALMSSYSVLQAIERQTTVNVVENLEELLQDLNVTEILSHIDFDSTIQKRLDDFIKAFSAKALETIKVDQFTNREESLHRIADTYGLESQLRQLQEECGELVVAVNKLCRKKESNEKCKEYKTFREYMDSFNHLAEEIADVENMVSQVKYLMQFELMVEKVRDEKIKRQLARIDGTEE